jgi:AraC-like DNA-binding protein
MSVVPVLHRSAAMRAQIRQGLPRRGWRVERCRSVERLQTFLSRRLVDAVVVDVRNGWAEPSLALIPQYPKIPFFAIGAFRPGDADLVRACRAKGVVEVLVEGVDDPAAGEVIAARSATRRRRQALADAPRLLRLTEPIQQRAWEEVLLRAGTRTTTADVARAVRRTREHLSREFGAGGAPNLKRVIDLVRVAWAADLLANPGYTTSDVARLLRFASPSHLAEGARRVAGARPAELGDLGPQGVLRRFVRGRTRSRI